MAGSAEHDERVGSSSGSTGDAVAVTSECVAMAVKRAAFRRAAAQKELAEVVRAPAKLTCPGESSEGHRYQR